MVEEADKTADKRGVSGEIPVIEAVEWRESAPGGGSAAQVFRLSDERFAIVKFPENPQGELVLANEFLCCQLAQYFDLPINRVVRVSIDERLLRLPRNDGKIPATFSGGIRCGMIRFEKPEPGQPSDIFASCSNSSELHHVILFEQLVCRQDGRQLLMYALEGESKKRFGAYDYGFAFGGNPNWTIDTLDPAPAPILPANDPFTGTAYGDGAPLAGFIDKLRTVQLDQLNLTLMELYPPRWGVTLDAVNALAKFLVGRAESLVKQFDERHRPQQLEVF